MVLQQPTFSPTPEFTGSRAGSPVYLKLTREELALIAHAVEAERTRLAHDTRVVHHCGSSQAAMDICHRRSAVEGLIDRLLAVQALPVVESRSPDQLRAGTLHSFAASAAA